LYVSTDSPALKELGLKLGAEIIDRPDRFASVQAPAEQAVVHGYQVIQKHLAGEGQSLELLVLMFANAATVTPQVIEEGIGALQANAAIDSAATVSSHSMWSPWRARRINSKGLLEPFVPLEIFGDPKTMIRDRYALGDVWFADMGVSVVRPRCLDNLESGFPPHRWMGQKIHPLRQWGGQDVDEPWQIPTIEAWLQAHEVDALFKVRRTKWNQFYDSERAVLSLLRLDSKSRVLDIGGEPGGLGLALRERFGVSTYTAAVADDDQANEVKAIYPEARVMMTQPSVLPITEGGEYDLVAALRTDDDPDFLGRKLRSAYEQLAPGGFLVFSTRLTDAATVHDESISHQVVFVGKGVKRKQAYIVRHTFDVLDILKSLGPARIFAYGYSGTPSSTAKTPFKTVCFCVFAVTRGGFGEGMEPPDVELQIPEQFLKPR
jgi:SAM-dependent methyltransferase